MIVVTHQGLGDHIICNGLMRVLAKEYGKIQIPTSIDFAGRNRVKLIEYMYRDDPNIEIIPVQDPHIYDPRFYIGKYLDDLIETYGSWIDSNDYMLLGYRDDFWALQGGPMTFDQGFYHLANIDYNKRFEEFYIQRDLEEEERIYNSLVNEDEEYIFIHDDPSRELHIDREKIRKDLKIIENDSSINFFNYRKLFENATELHLMQSGIHDFCCSIPLPKPDIYVHRYVRNHEDWLWAGSINERIKVL